MKLRVLLLVAAELSAWAASAHAEWYGSFDAMAVTRSMPSLPVLQYNQTTSGEPAVTRVGTVAMLSARDLDLDFISGGRATLGARGDLVGLEASYLLTDEWNQSASAVGSAGALLASPFTPVGATVNQQVDNNTTATVQYLTKMQTADVVLTHRAYAGPHGNASLLLGAKSIWIDETFNYSTTNADRSNGEQINVNNWLCGPELGVWCEAPFPGGKLDLTFKFAVVNNAIDKTDLLNGTAVAGDNAGLASDIGINASFFLTERTRLRIGYNVLSITDVALATDNIHNLAVPAPPIVGVNSDRDVAYQSLYLSLEFGY